MKNRVEVWKMVVNIKLVKLTAEYKKQLTDMMDEWLAAVKGLLSICNSKE